jgi:hypothetical protein
MAIMALVFCTKCGHRVSTSAPKCPSCGAPPYNRSAATSLSTDPASAPAAARSDRELKAPVTFGTPSKNSQYRVDKDKTPTKLKLPAYAALLAFLAAAAWFIVSGPFHAGQHTSDTIDCSSPPSFVKEVEMGHQGEDGLDVWFTLADEGNNETCADGTVTITISELVSEDPEYGVPLLTTEHLAVKSSDFAKWSFTNKLTGAVSEKLMWDSGRIPYSNFSRQPFPGMDFGEMGQTEVVFTTTSGSILRGKSDGTFDFAR